ncbi:MAG: Mov34/MPN/PAD-1 family protein [Alphaproteobacteria bacterium]|nr:Mov34/MPN/PAD-1 family protein [Alphaproteobacteria bacterium]
MAADEKAPPLERHTATQTPDDPARLSAAIAEAVAALRAAFPDQPVPALYWNKDYVAVPLEVGVELPSRGPIGAIDIRAREPVFLLFDRKRYPFKAPSAWSDRKDFPKSKLPHLNPTKPGAAANFCLHRGSLDAWFAEHAVLDLVGRVRFWLRDAARGRLIPHRDLFEPTRPYDPFGQTVFDPVAFTGTVTAAWADHDGSAGFRLVAYELLDKEAEAAIGMSGYTARSVTVVPPDEAQTQLTLARVINELADNDAYKKLFKKRLFGVLAWANADTVTDEHFAELPDTLDGLIAWTERLGIPSRDALTIYLDGDFHLLGGVPVTVAIRRPRPVLGAGGDIELITFLIIAGGEHWPKNGAWDLGATVYVADHRTPLTPPFARHLSSHARDVAIPRTLLLGCGALGSKLALHFGRSGQTSLTLVDPALLSPHNVVRHALGGRRIGMAKSEALKEQIVELYPGQTEEALGITANTADALDYLLGDRQAELEAHSHLVDATASVQVFNMLVGAPLPATLSVVRLEIGDRGRLGLLSLEGPGRNPRLDDLQAALFDFALDDPAVSRWLTVTREARESQVGSGLEEIQIGLSCGSATMRLADETASFHAAGMAGRLRARLSATEIDPRAGGVIYRTVLEEGGAARADERKVSAVTIATARNDPRWQVRFAGGLVDRMRDALRQARPSETGGLMIGMVHAKRRTVYVTRLLDAPRDSEGTPMAFVRGVDDLPEAVADIERRSGGLLGYVGEWHTHPGGGPDLSITDLVAASRLKRVLDLVPLPTHIVVVTPRGVYPHVFEAGTDGLLVRGRFRVAVEAR